MDQSHQGPRLQAFMSAFTQSDHVFLGLPRTFEHGTSILVTDLIQDEDRTTCPYHLRRLERRTAVTSCIPSLAHNKSMEISSCGLYMSHIYEIYVKKCLSSLQRTSNVENSTYDLYAIPKNSDSKNPDGEYEFWLMIL